MRAHTWGSPAASNDGATNTISQEETERGQFTVRASGVVGALARRVAGLAHDRDTLTAEVRTLRADADTLGARLDRLGVPR